MCHCCYFFENGSISKLLNQGIIFWWVVETGDSCECNVVVEKVQCRSCKVDSLNEGVGFVRVCEWVERNSEA